MIIKEYSTEYKKQLLEAFELTKDLGCPPEQYRVKEHTKCYNCNECWTYALMNSMDEDKKAEQSELEVKIEKLVSRLNVVLATGDSDFTMSIANDIAQQIKTLQDAINIMKNN